MEAQPSLDLHRLSDPDVHGAVLDVIFAGRPARIPTAAITGTDGATATATADILARIWTAAGRLTGLCTTAQVRIGGDLVGPGNLPDPGGQIILNDPAVEAAVFEIPRTSLIDVGQPCDCYDVVALLDIGGGYPAGPEGELLQRATRAVVVNADDPRCMAMLTAAGANRSILVSADPDTVAGHRQAGGHAVVIGRRDGQDWSVLCEAGVETALVPAGAGRATMFAAALAWAQGLEIGAVRAALGYSAMGAVPGVGR